MVNHDSKSTTDWSQPCLNNGQPYFNQSQPWQEKVKHVFLNPTTGNLCQPRLTKVNHGTWSRRANHSQPRVAKVNHSHNQAYALKSTLPIHWSTMVWYNQTYYKVNHAQTMACHGLKSTMVYRDVTTINHAAATVNHAALTSSMSEHCQTMA